jgi:pimeloyl-ACP methyl ester carboxylesterase
LTKLGPDCQEGLFVPGWGAIARLYEPGLPCGWKALELPSYRRTRGDFSNYRRWLTEEVLERPLELGGHSMGGTLALLAAIERPELVQRLVLVSPAGLPLTKTMRSSTATFVRQAASGRYRPRHLGWMVGRVAASPFSAHRLARSVHRLDLRPELPRFDVERVPCTVVGCSTDTLTPPAHCRELAAALGADYREVEAPDGHIWPVTQPQLLAAVLSG